MKKKIAIIIVLSITFLVYLSFGFNVYGFNADDWNPIDNVSIQGGSVINNLGKTITGIIRIVGSAVSIIAILLIGIKYMLGSIEEKAEYKKSMGPYIIGAIMVFGISNIVDILYQLGSTITK